MTLRPLYTITFHEVQFTAQIDLDEIDQLRNVCESSNWFEEFVTKRMLSGGPEQNPVSFQFGRLNGLTNVWFGFWHKGGRCASFTLVKTVPEGSTAA